MSTTIHPRDSLTPFSQLAIGEAFVIHRDGRVLIKIDSVRAVMLDPASTPALNPIQPDCTALYVIPVRLTKIEAQEV